jgi:hypothetical protein
MNEIKKWDNDIYEFDVTQASRLMNPWLKNYGKDRLTFSPETPYSSAVYHAQHEAAKAHGYPGTAWLQLGLVYAVGLYTAKEQGIVKKKVFFQKYWQAHYFDWLLFARRAGIYGIGGGIILGTYIFGDVRLSVRRAHSKYNYWFAMEKQDPYGRETMYFIRSN